MLTSLGENAPPSASDIEKILTSVGIDAEGDRVKRVISELKGNNLEEVIKEGSKKLASVPSCGGGDGGGVAASAPAAGGKIKEEKTKEKEESEESNDDMGLDCLIK